MMNNLKIKVIVLSFLMMSIFSHENFASNIKPLAITNIVNNNSINSSSLIQCEENKNEEVFSVGDFLTIFSIFIAFWILYRDLNFNSKSRYLDRISDYMKDIDGIIVGRVINSNTITNIELSEKYLINSYIDALESYVNLIKYKSFLQKYILPNDEFLNYPLKLINLINKETLASLKIIECLSKYKSFIQRAGVDNLNNDTVNLDVDELLHHSSLLSTALEEYLSLVKRYF